MNASTMNKIFFLLTASLLFLVACKKELYIATASGEKITVRNLQFDYLKSKAKFKFSDGVQNISASANFRVQKDSVIWASISPALGVEIARLKITRKGIRAIDKLKKDYYEFDYETLSKTYGIDINYDLIEAIVLGNPLFLPPKEQTVQSDGEQLKYERKNDKIGIRHYIGTKSGKLEKLYAFDVQTFNAISVDYGEFTVIDERIVPGKIMATVSFANQRRRKPVEMEIEYNRTAFQKEPLTFPFHVSGKYSRK